MVKKPTKVASITKKTVCVPLSSSISGTVSNAACQSHTTVMRQSRTPRRIVVGTWYGGTGGTQCTAPACYWL